MLVALPTKGDRGLGDVICERFARAPYLTIVEAESGRVVGVVKNEFTRLSHGVGPIIVKMLRDMGVSLIGLPEAGVGVKQLIRELGMGYFAVRPGEGVSEALERIRR